MHTEHPLSLQEKSYCWLSREVSGNLCTQNISENFLNVAVKAVDEQVGEFMVRDHSLFCPEETLFGRKNIILKINIF